MKLKYNRKDELEIPGLGIFKPNQIVIEKDETEAQNYLDTGYFDKVRPKKSKKPKKNKMKEVIR